MTDEREFRKSPKDGRGDRKEVAHLDPARIGTLALLRGSLVLSVLTLDIRGPQRLR